MTWNEVLEKARSCSGPYCKACPTCNGRGCKNLIPGPGAKGEGEVAILNYEAWRRYRINLDTLCAGGSIDTSFSLFGREFKYPIFAGPVGAVAAHYSDLYNDSSFCKVIAPACAEAGIAAFTGDCIDPAVFAQTMEGVKMAGGIAVPTVKPWDIDTVADKVASAKESGAFAIAMDVDAAGLPFLKGRTPPAGCKSVEELGEIIRMAGLPFIVKGVMTVSGAKKAIEAGADAIIVSNHGGRVLDGCPATADVLPVIADAVGGKAVILVDGGIRTGVDVFRALALGADAVVVARPYVTAVYGGGAEGVGVLTRQLGDQLADTMELCGARKLSDINRSMIWGL